MVYEVHRPAYPLSLFIESFVYYRDYNPIHSVDRFLPDGNIYVVIDLTDYPKFIYDNNTLKEIQSCRNIWFSGIRTNYLTIPSGRDSEMFIINFHKGKAYPFVEMPMHELTDYVVDGELVMSPQILDMRDRLLELGSITAKFLFAEKYLLQAFSQRLVTNPFIEFSIDVILKSPQQPTIKYLSDKTGFSQKHFISIFKTHVGITPKAFLKIIRFQKAIREIETKTFTSWTSIAYDAGYYDQAHFINDFKHFSGFSPGQFREMNSEFTNYVAVG